MPALKKAKHNKILIAIFLPVILGLFAIGCFIYLTGRSDFKPNRTTQNKPRRSHVTIGAIPAEEKSVVTVTA